MKRLLTDTCHAVSKRKAKRLSAKAYKALQQRYRTILTQGERELPPIPPRHKGQRGRVAKSDAHNLWERLKKYESAVLRFAKHPDVAFTNNRAERDLRMSKVKQKGLERMLPHPKVRRSVLPNLKLSPVHGQPGIQSLGGHSDRSRPGALSIICPSSYPVSSHIDLGLVVLFLDF